MGKRCSSCLINHNIIVTGRNLLGCDLFSVYFCINQKTEVLRSHPLTTCRCGSITLLLYPHLFISHQLIRSLDATLEALLLHSRMNGSERFRIKMNERLDFDMDQSVTPIWMRVSPKLQLFWFPGLQWSVATKEQLVKWDTNIDVCGQ